MLNSKDLEIYISLSRSVCIVQYYICINIIIIYCVEITVDYYKISRPTRIVFNNSSRMELE